MKAFEPHPESVRGDSSFDYAARFTGRSDTARWLSQRAVPTLHGPDILLSTLYKDYRRWCALEHVEPVRKLAFALHLKKLGLERNLVGDKGVRLWRSGS